VETDALNVGPQARRLVRWLLVFALVIAPVRAAHAQHEEPSSPRAQLPLTILQINDVYSMIPVDGMGGVARVATIKNGLVAAGRTPLLVIAGDFLSPSVASSIFKGEQMVAALNSAGLDIATLGNHEFDFGTDVLLQRMAEARWQWVVSNVIDTNTNRPVGGAVPYAIRSYGALKVGFIGLCLSGDEVSRERLQHLRLDDPIETAATLVPFLKRQGADLIVALTHLSFDDDRKLAARFPDIDLIIGGHEHYPITAIENRTFISKAGSDGRYVARIDVNKRQDGMVERFFELIPVTASIVDDPKTAAVVSAYETRLGTELDVVVGSSRVPLDADSIRMRAAETNLGNMFADAMRAEVGADITIVNSGSIRGDRIYPAGALSRRTLLAMHPFGGVVGKVEVTGETVLKALNAGVARMPQTDGRFPQISGMTMTVTPAAPVGRRISNVMIGGRPLELTRTYTVAVTDYELTGGDGYDMFPGQKVLVNGESGPLITVALQNYVSARGEVAPATDGRILIER
jgi:2',3'-cyclic-nucleotide 2'-phosphodiesterase (5'-nucleotidase family)